jgi:hypothetical protein
LGDARSWPGGHEDARRILAEALRLWEELGEAARAAETRAALAALISSAGDRDVIGAGE